MRATRHTSGEITDTVFDSMRGTGLNLTAAIGPGSRCWLSTISSLQQRTSRYRTARETGRSQPVGATPSDMNSFSKGGVYGTRETEQAFHGAEDRHVAPLEGGRVVA